MIIKPTAGRVVWFYPGVHNPLASDQPLAAIVTYVHSDHLVNLAVFDANGALHPKTSIELRQEGDEDLGRTSEGPYCAWMPYQLATAKEAAVRYLASHSRESDAS